MFRAIPSTCIYASRILLVTLAVSSLTGCAAVVTAVALVPVQMVSDVIVKSVQTGIDTAAAAAHTAVVDNAE